MGEWRGGTREGTSDWPKGGELKGGKAGKGRESEGQRERWTEELNVNEMATKDCFICDLSKE